MRGGGVACKPGRQASAINKASLHADIHRCV